MKYLKIRWIAVLLVAVGTSFFFGFKSGDNRSFQVAKNLDIFNSIVKELDMFYVDTIDPNKTIRTGIESMLYSLDPYTQYFPEDDQSELEQMLKNTYGGIGSIITWNTKLKRSMIAEPYEHMPAATVGSGREVATDTIYGFHRVYNYNASLGINTKIYGMYNPIFFPKKKIQIRHVITPSVSISAAPDFGSSRYGYYDSYIKNYADGRRDTVVYSPYAGQAFDVPGRGKQGNITFSISNNLEMKYYSSKKDTIKKISLIDELGANINYNMAAATRPWGDLGLNLRLKLSKNYTFSMSSSFKTYGYKFDKNGNVVENDRTEWSYGRFGIFQGYGSSFSYTFNNETWKKWKEKLSGTKDADKEKDKENSSEEGEDAEASSDESGIPKKKVEKAAVDADGYQVFKMPWSLNFNYSFNISEDRSKPINRKKMRYPYRYTHNLSASGNIKLSNKWAVSFNSGYDFEAKKIVQTTFNITRDLHCFSMSASLSPFGQWKYYNFTIRANASILQDLKWEQRSQTQSNIQWY